MRSELATITSAIESHSLPIDFPTLLSDVWDSEKYRFHVQETYILDYKETVPTSFSSGYGASIIRLGLAFHNSYGGLIIFGVKDRELTVTGLSDRFDIESFNRALTDFATVSVECLYKRYYVQTGHGEVALDVVLVPKRGAQPPARLTKGLDKYAPGKLWVRDRHEVMEAGVRHMPILYSSRTVLPSESGARTGPAVHRSLPPSPATIDHFVNRGHLLSSLWDWFVYGTKPRIYLHGPGGSGKSTLAYEFARLLAESGHDIVSKSGDRLDYVIYISGKDTELNPSTGTQQPFQLQQFTIGEQQIAQILYHSGFLNENDINQTSLAILEPLLDELFELFWAYRC